MTAREPRDLHNREDLHNVSILTISTAGVFQHNPSPDNKRHSAQECPTRFVIPESHRPTCS